MLWLLLLYRVYHSTALPQLLVDSFNSTSHNALGLWHGLAEGTADFQETDGGSYLRVSTANIDASFSTSLSEGCADLSIYRDSYIHISYSGSAKFTVSLQQHNIWCDDSKVPFPQTWDSVEARRYSQNNADIYIPLSHFNVNLTRIDGIAIEGFYSAEPTYFYLLEIVDKVSTPIPPKLDTGTLYSSCNQPNLIAFGIDDGSPELAQRTLQIVREEKIPVTFFVQGQALNQMEDNFTDLYREAYKSGHQIALHTFDHPHVESLPSDTDIDAEFSKNIAVLQEALQVRTRYFRPPFGTLGARTRQSLSRYVEDARIILWTIDVKDWMYGESDTTGLQYKQFENDFNAGGDIVVMHYLYKSTVDQLRAMIKLAKDKGRQFVRVDQCLNDPEAPRSWGWKPPTVN